LALALACTKQKPLDEGSFQQLLAAAYVMQEHSRSLPEYQIPPKNARILPEVGEIQSAVRAVGLSLSDASKLIADRLLATVNASGVSISLVSNGYLDCVAESGAPANVPGSSLASHSLVATERLKSGRIFDSADAQTDIRLDCSMCRRLRIESLVAAPILRLGEIAGLIEVRWPNSNAFQEAQLSTIKGVARLVSEMLEPQAPTVDLTSGQPDKTVPSEPNVASQDETVPIAGSNSVVDFELSAAQSPAHDLVSAQDASAAAPVLTCRVCGRDFRADEVFCGYCSMPRAASAPSEGLQSKWASLWFIQKAQSTLEACGERTLDAKQSTEAIASPATQPAPEPNYTDVHVPHAMAASNGANFSYFQPIAEDYRATARLDLLEEDEPQGGETWARISQSLRNKIRVRDVILVLVAGALTFGVVSAWPSSAGQLTWFGSAMLRLGLARNSAPSAVYGNPDASVWIDMKSRLYYCEGSDLYGTTHDGRFSTQRKAQLDHFEPATGLACQ
jgi:hypothetical protein